MSAADMETEEGRRPRTTAAPWDCSTAESGNGEVLLRWWRMLDGDERVERRDCKGLCLGVRRQ